ncbi:phosphoribosyltransferase [Chitinispirillales bacterium ANBcel5]|uniref:phosphoribosyltransferase n=1 Tax=Cellulosispirillum alkaliphilum TaxID=3039283 RepID=UPI002A53E359|nr:phosphoribosyltransferase [Chitinispirillales bacterium ANBcel5]
MAERYGNRSEAGRELVKYLDHYIGTSNLLVLGLPRGGVVVAYEIASLLDSDLDIFLVRKLGTPGEPELAMGAIAEGGIVQLNESVVKFLSISKETVEQVAEEQLAELRRRERMYRQGREPFDIRGKAVIVVDDGLATGATMKVALEAISRQNPERLIVAVPVGSPSTTREIRGKADDVICPLQPDNFTAVGAWYDEFDQTSDEEVIELLKKRREEQEGK